MNVLDAASVFVAALGVVAGVVVSSTTGRLRVAVQCALELWTAAGLLHLVADAGWRAIGSAALVIAVRKLVAAGLAAPPVLS